MTPPNQSQNTLIGAAAILASQLTQYAGAATAKNLFPIVGATGVAGLRVGLAALILAVVLRPWRHPPDPTQIPGLVLYGATMGLMNLLIYLAFARIPIGIAVAIEVTGPLALVLFGARRPLDFLWLAAAIAGLLMLAPLQAAAELDPLGVLFTIGAALCWALYIVFGRRVAGPRGGSAVAWGTFVAAFLVVPVAVESAGGRLLEPAIFVGGLTVAALSSAIPYTLEMAAMARLPGNLLGMLLSASPAVAALMGHLLLDERLTSTQWVAIICIVVATGGSALTIRTRPQAR